MTPRPQVKIDDLFEEEARAMVRAMETGELPPRSKPYFDRVKGYAELHWTAKASRRSGGRP
jgi:hypothetical protein